jgi:hypothetical protein
MGLQAETFHSGELAGLWSMGLEYLKGMGLVEWRSCVSVDCCLGRLLVHPGRGGAVLCRPKLWPSRAEIVWPCAGLRVQPAEIMHVWIASLAGLKGLVWQRLCRSEEWEFGVALPWWG